MMAPRKPINEAGVGNSSRLCFVRRCIDCGDPVMVAEVGSALPRSVSAGLPSSVAKVVACFKTDGTSSPQEIPRVVSFGGAGEGDEACVDA